MTLVHLLQIHQVVLCQIIIESDPSTDLDLLVRQRRPPDTRATEIHKDLTNHVFGEAIGKHNVCRYQEEPSDPAINSILSDGHDVKPLTFVLWHTFHPRDQLP